MKLRPGVVPQWPEQPRLDVLGLQRLSQQRVVQQVDLADREVVGRAPVGVDEGELLGGQRSLGRAGGRPALRVVRSAISLSSFVLPLPSDAGVGWGTRGAVAAALFR